MVIPAYNSAAVLEATVRRFADHFAGRRVEIIVVENGSTDDTARLCRELADGWSDPTVSFVPLTSDKGMGNALRVGALASTGARVLLTADDLPFGFDDIDGAEKHPADGRGGPRVLIGSKAHPDSRIDRGVGRVVMTRGFALLRRAILGTRTGDPQGTFIVDGVLLRNLAGHLTETGFLFTTELDYAVELAGIRPVELPVRLSDEHRAHASRISPSDVAQMARGLVGLRRRKSVLQAAAAGS
ncbi:hypothetical protein GCM10023094_45730 [Rhodococcus olei]|uniref:Glycosyltransferase 2-like domain-containing protein n=1 Tax=Rhodococcus olei TaxID=2161675 RepID=A0ABP8PIS5_9NOCA